MRTSTQNFDFCLAKCTRDGLECSRDEFCDYTYEYYGYCRSCPTINDFFTCDMMFDSTSEVFDHCQTRCEFSENKPCTSQKECRYGYFCVDEKCSSCPPDCTIFGKTKLFLSIKFLQKAHPKNMNLHL